MWFNCDMIFNNTLNIIKTAVINDTVFLVQRFSMPPTHHRRCFQVEQKFFIQRRRNEQKKKMVNESVNQMGIGRVFDRKRSIGVRIVWLCIILLCSIGCLNHIALRISEFIENPVAIDLQLQHRSHIFFPSVTICSGVLGSYLKQDLRLWHQQKLCVKNKTDCTEKVMADISYLSKSIDQADVDWMWNEEAAIQPNHLKIEESCSSTKSIGNKKCEQTIFPIPLRFITTLWGRCIDISFPKPMPYRGSFTGFTIKLNTEDIEKYKALEEEYYFFLHRREVIPRHDAPYIAQAVKVGYETSVRVSIQEYEFLNTRQKPCTSEAETIECQNNCIDDLMGKNLTCSLPFIESRNLRDCKTVKEFFESFHAAYEVYSTLKSTDCQCKQKCDKISYKMSIIEQKLKSKNVTHIVLSYPQNLYETLVENAVYSKSALISEIGGTIGLYLGLSMMRIFDLLESTATRGTLHAECLK
uniref:Uncharacterized protein n=1 Tax=Strigamia maritima TaxID=126957 RepID=T1IV96_STRMM